MPYTLMMIMLIYGGVLFSLGVVVGVLIRDRRHPEPDTSDIPEVDESWFRKAKLRLPKAD